MTAPLTRSSALDSPVLELLGAVGGARSPLGPLTLTIQAGERVALLGAGGDQILQWWVRLAEPASGRVAALGQDVQTIDPIALRRQVARVSGTAKLLAPTVGAALAYPLQLAGRSSHDIQTAVAAALDRFEIPTTWLTRQDFQLSPADLLWIAIARASLLEPRVWLFDDDLACLSEFQRDRLRSWLESATLGPLGAVTVVMAAATVEAIAPIATRCILLEAGQLVLDRPAAQIDWSEISDRLQTQTAAGQIGDDDWF